MMKLLLVLLVGSGIGGYLAERQLGFWHPAFVNSAQRETIAACSTALQASSTAAMQAEKFANRLNLNLKDQIPDVLETIATSPNARQQSTIVCRSLILRQIR